jgi:hypothetical protein
VVCSHEAHEGHHGEVGPQMLWVPISRCNNVTPAEALLLVRRHFLGNPVVARVLATPKRCEGGSRAKEFAADTRHGGQAVAVTAPNSQPSTINCSRLFLTRELPAAPAE